MSIISIPWHIEFVEIRALDVREQYIFRFCKKVTISNYLVGVTALTVDICCCTDVLLSSVISTCIKEV